MFCKFITKILNFFVIKIDELFKKMASVEKCKNPY